MQFYNINKVIRMNARDSYFSVKSKLIKDGGEKSVLCNSFPKSGTHLLYQILNEIGVFRKWDDITSVQSLSGYANTKSHVKNKILSAPQQSIIRSHIPHDDELLDFFDGKNIKVITIVRDLRDVVVSHANWVMNEPKIYLNPYYANYLNNFDERLMASIKGIPQGVPLGSNVVLNDIGSDFGRWAPWADAKNSLIVKFEDLVDKNSTSYVSVVEKIYNFLGLSANVESITEKHISNISNPMNSHTYSKGLKKGSGAWKKYFNEEHKVEFKRLANNHLLNFGYIDKGEDW